MSTEKRNGRTYKIKDKHYRRALRKAAKTEKSLSQRIEEFVIEYGKPEKKVKGIDLPHDYLRFSKVGVLQPDGKVTDPI